MRREDGERLLDGHGEDVGDGVPCVADAERLLREPAPAAHVAIDVHVGEEAHLHAQPTLARAGLAASTRDVEREPPRAPAAQPRLGNLREETPDVVVEADVRRGRGARRATDRRLVDLDGPRELLESLDGAMRADPAAR